MAHFDYYEASRQIAEYEKRKPKKYRNSGWRYYNSNYRGAKYGRILPETGFMYYMTQAWPILKKCWLGYKIAKSQDDFEKMMYYAEGIRRAQKELGLPVESFPNQDMCDDNTNSRKDLELGDSLNKDDSEESYGYESEAQREWRKRMEQPYESPAQKASRERIQKYY